MTFTQKFMVLIRWIIFLSLLGYILTMNLFYLYSGFLTISFLLAGYLYASISGIASIPTINMEGFRADNTVIQNKAFPTLKNDNLYLEDDSSFPSSDSGFYSEGEINVVAGKKKHNNQIPLKEVLDKEYYKETWKNPFGNMLLPEIKYDPNRKSAPPSFNMKVAEDITRNVKKAIQNLNPGIQNTNKQLFGDLYNNFLLDNSNRVFYSMPSTRVENDQSAFSKFLYHDLIFSGKESTVEGGLARIQDNYRYTMY